MREMCEGQLTVSAYFQVLSTFQNNKAPRNDGLSAEFTSRKEAIKILTEKKDRDWED